MPTEKQVIPLRRIIPLHSSTNVIFPSRIVIATKSAFRFIETNNILFLKSDSNYTEIYLKDGSKIVTSITLKKYEVKLDFNDFMRVHNRYIVRLSQIEYFYHQENMIILYNTEKVPVSRSKKEQLTRYLKTLTV